MIKRPTGLLGFIHFFVVGFYLENHLVAYTYSTNDYREIYLETDKQKQFD